MMAVQTIRSGDLRESVTIEVPIRVENDYGEQEDRWVEFANRRALIAGRSVSEVAGGEQIWLAGSYEVVMRHVSGLTTEMRLLWTSRTPSMALDITNIVEIGNREGHRVTVKGYE